MAKKKNNGGWWIALTGVGVVLLYYVKTGQDCDSKLLPDPLEQQIDTLIAELNGRYGRDWVKKGLDALAYSLE